MIGDGVEKEEVGEDFIFFVSAQRLDGTRYSTGSNGLHLGLRNFIFWALNGVIISHLNTAVNSKHYNHLISYTHPS